MTEKSRGEYTYGDLAQDLAVTTRLTIRESLTWSQWMECNDIHPYDAMPHITSIVRSMPDVNVGPMFFSAVAALFDLKDPGPTLRMPSTEGKS